MVISIDAERLFQISGCATTFHSGEKDKPKGASDMEAELAKIADTIRDHREVLLTEEAAKNALVMPFLQALGYNVFDPGEVVPEYTADVGTKRGEKVDYAICDGSQVRILVECKPANVELKIENASQLYRYFSVVEARVAILTNGVVYNFYSDIEAANRMDERPFFTCRLDDLRKSDIETLERFSKQSFDIDTIVAEAGNLKLQRLVRNQLEQEFADPSGELVRLVASKVFSGRLTGPVVDRFKVAIRIGIAAIIRERVNTRLASALDDPHDGDEQLPPEERDEIVTTDVERQGFHIVTAIGAALVSPSRIVMRDAKSYCAVLLDDNNRKTIARLHFNSDTSRYFGTFQGKEETRHPVNEPRDIYGYAEAIMDRIKVLDES